MFVCVCKAVTDVRIGEVIDAGAQSREEVTRACGAGGDCGACCGMIEELLEDRLVAADKLVRSHAA